MLNDKQASDKRIADVLDRRISAMNKCMINSHKRQQALKNVVVAKLSNLQSQCVHVYNKSRCTICGVYLLTVDDFLEEAGDEFLDDL